MVFGYTGKKGDTEEHGDDTEAHGEFIFN